MDASDTPTPWDEEFAGFDMQPRLQAFDMTQLSFDHQWEMIATKIGRLWQITTMNHPALNAMSDLSKYWVVNKGGHIQHFNTEKPDKEGMGVFSSFLYPNASITVSKNFCYIMRCIPISEKQTKMEYEVYRGLNATDEEFTWISELFKQVFRKDKDLCNAAQKNLQAGIFTNGELHPEAEKGPLYFQKLSKELVMSHRKEEEEAGKDIWPARPAKQSTSEGDEETSFCAKLDCGNGPVELEW